MNSEKQVAIPWWNLTPAALLALGAENYCAIGILGASVVFGPDQSVATQKLVRVSDPEPAPENAP